MKDAAVKRGVVRRQEVGAFEKFLALTPDDVEQRLSGNIPPGDPVDVGPQKLPPRRSNPSTESTNDLPAFNADQGDSASAISAVVRSLEVDGDEAPVVGGQGDHRTMVRQSQIRGADMGSPLTQVGGRECGTGSIPAHAGEPARLGRRTARA